MRLTPGWGLVAGAIAIGLGVGAGVGAATSGGTTRASPAASTAPIVASGTGSVAIGTAPSGAVSLPALRARAKHAPTPKPPNQEVTHSTITPTPHEEPAKTPERPPAAPKHKEPEPPPLIVNGGGG
jgi:hypothetical protein